LVVASETRRLAASIFLSVEGGTPRLLTPGNCEVEQWSLTTDKKTLLFNSNCGDIDRRHIWRVSLDKVSRNLSPLLKALRTQALSGVRLR